MSSMFENKLVRAAALGDAAVGHDYDALGKVGDDFHVVADHDYSAAALGMVRTVSMTVMHSR
ncbi:MAG: hypothetical protein ACLS3M_08190 [Collinsella sp.]